jgi:hypothetical protein
MQSMCREKEKYAGMWYLLLATTERSEGWEEEGGVKDGEENTCNSEHPVIG